MKRLTAMTLALGLSATALMLAALPADAKSDHRHHYKDGSYGMTCVNEEKTCGNWNIGKPN